MKIVIPGGSGQIGQTLTEHLSRHGHEVVVLSRHPREGAIAWDGEHQGPWAEEIDGAFDVFSTLVRRGLGGAQGDGRQFVSWIHEHDFAAAVEFLLGRDLAGPVNLAAPNPLPNREFMRTLRKEWGVPFGIPAPAPLLEIGAWVMGTETELVLKSRRAVPRRLKEAGFSFQFPLWPQAANDLVARATSST